MKNLFLLLAFMVGLTTNAQCVSGDCINGEGVYEWPNGDVYKGSFKNKKYDGFGVYTWADGEVYSGMWKDDKQFKGKCTGDCENGLGVLEYANGEKYAGYFKNGKRDGAGELDDVNGKTIHYGLWKNDEFSNIKTGCVSGDCVNGFGTYNDLLGSVYVGDFKNSKFEGKGTYKWQDGSVYIGDWKNNVRDGLGTYTNSKGEVFAGAMKNNAWFKRGCLSGDCKDGFGTFVYEGTIYIGQFKNGREDGEGTSIETNGTTYKGQWRKGLKKGFGVETDPDGITLAGNWDVLYLRGQGIETLPNGYYMKANYTHLNWHKSEKYFTKDNVEIKSKEYYTKLENEFSAKKNQALAIAAQPKCISGDCQNGYGVIQYNDGTKYYGMCKNGTYEGLGYVVNPDVTTYEYESLYSLKKIAVTTPGTIYYGEWINGVNTRSFSSLEEFSDVVSKINGGYQFSDGLYKINKSNMDAVAKQQKAENDAAEAKYYNDKMKNVSFSNTSSSSSTTSNSTASGNGTTTTTRIYYNGDGTSRMETTTRKD